MTSGEIWFFVIWGFLVFFPIVIARAKEKPSDQITDVSKACFTALILPFMIPFSRSMALEKRKR